MAGAELMRRWIWAPTIAGCWSRGRRPRDFGSSTRLGIVRLGEGLSLTGRLSEAAIGRTLEALKVCRDKMAARGVTRARTIATEARRSAANGPAFFATVRERVGIELEIVDRETEAHLAAAGVGDLADKEARSTVMFYIRRIVGDHLAYFRSPRACVAQTGSRLGNPCGSGWSRWLSGSAASM